MLINIIWIYLAHKNTILSCLWTNSLRGQRCNAVHFSKIAATAATPSHRLITKNSPTNLIYTSIKHSETAILCANSVQGWNLGMVSLLACRAATAYKFTNCVRSFRVCHISSSWILPLICLNTPPKVPCDTVDISCQNGLCRSCRSTTELLHSRPNESLCGRYVILATTAIPQQHSNLQY